MAKNIFKHSLRALNRQKGYVLINIVGLSIGIACSLLIALFVINELSYDQFHVNKDRIYRVNLHGKIGGTEAHVSSTASPVGPTMMRDFPEVENFTRYNTSSTTVVKYRDQSFTEDAFVYVDSSFFNIFSIPLLRGDKNKVLTEPYTIVISETTAKKYFGSDDPIDKMLKIGTDSSLYRVTGLMEDIPENSSFQANIFASFLSSRRANDGQWLSK